MTDSYYSLLGLNQSFTLDLAALETAYFKVQRQWHPDRFVGKPEGDRLQAMQRSADVNQAYETLKNPLKRAQYLLQLQGIAVGTEADNIKPSPELLMEAMEMRETPPAAAALDRMIGQSQAAIAGHYAAQAWQDMALETLRLGYLLKARGA